MRSNNSSSNNYEYTKVSQESDITLEHNVAEDQYIEYILHLARESNIELGRGYSIEQEFRNIYLPSQHSYLKSSSLISISNEHQCTMSREVILLENNSHDDRLNIVIIITPPSAINCEIPNNDVILPKPTDKDKKLIVDCMIQRLKKDVKITYHFQGEKKNDFSIENTKKGLVDYFFDSDEPQIRDTNIFMQNGSYIIKISIENILKSCHNNKKIIIGFSMGQELVKHLEMMVYEREYQNREENLYEQAIEYSNLVESVAKENLKDESSFNKAKMLNLFLLNKSERMVIKLEETKPPELIQEFVLFTMSKSISKGYLLNEKESVESISMMKVNSIHPMVMIAAISSLHHSPLIYEYVFSKGGDIKNYSRALLLCKLSVAIYGFTNEEKNLLNMVTVFVGSPGETVEETKTINQVHGENENVNKLNVDMLNYSKDQEFIEQTPNNQTGEDKFVWMMKNYQAYISNLSSDLKISPSVVSETTLYTDTRMIMDLIGLRYSTNIEKILSYYMDNSSLIWESDKTRNLLEYHIVKLIIDCKFQKKVDEQPQVYQSTIQFLRSLSKPRNLDSQFLYKISRTIHFIESQPIEKLTKLDHLYINKTIKESRELILKWENLKENMVIEIESDKSGHTLFQMYNFVLLQECVNNCEYLIALAEYLGVFESIEYETLMGYVCVLRYLLDFTSVLLGDMGIHIEKECDTNFQNVIINSILTKGIKEEWCESLLCEIGYLGSITKISTDSLSTISYLLKLNIKLEDVLDSHKLNLN